MKALSSLLLLWGPLCLFAQEWQCVKNFTDSGAARPAGISGFDKQGNVYLNTAWHTYSGHGGGGFRTYRLKKFDSNCNQLWSVNVNGVGNFQSVTDAAGSTYLAGLDKIRKYNSSGALVWEINTQMQKGFGTVLLHPSGGIVVNGVEKTNDGNRTFISRYNTEGNVISTVYDHVGGLMAIDGQGNYFFVCEGDVDSNTGNWGHLYKYSPGGALLFHHIVPHTPTRISADDLGNIYLTGWHSIYPIEINNVRYNEPGNYLIKYDFDGNHIWHKHITPFGWIGGGPFSPEPDGSLLYAINYSKMNIDELSFTSPGSDLFISGITSGGDIQWYIRTAVDVSTQPGGLTPTDIKRSPTGEIYVTGMMNGSHQLSPFHLETEKESGHDDLFLARLWVSKTVGVAQPSGSDINDEIAIFPNPSGHAFSLSTFLPEEQRISHKVLDIQGKCLLSAQPEKAQGIYERHIDLSDHPKGVYFLEIRIGNERHMRKLVRN